jgi:hypothetical protein
VRLRLGFISPEASDAGAPPAPTVEDILSGSGGFALDLSDTSLMWQDSAKAALVTTGGQSIGAVDSKWGASSYTFTAGSARRPIWNGSNAGDFDGTDDRFDGTASALAFTNNKPAFFGCVRFYLDSFAAAFGVYGFAGSALSSSRVVLICNADGSLNAQLRNVDGGTLTSLTSATGVIVAAQDYIVTMDVDYAGTRAIRVFVNGTQVISGTLTQTAGNTSATDSNAVMIGRRLNIAEQINGKMGRMVFADKLFTSDEIATIEAWVGEGALS